MHILQPFQAVSAFQHVLVGILNFKGDQLRLGHSAADKIGRAWPAELWKPLNLEAVVAEPVSVPPSAQQPCAPIRLQTNDEALVENKDVASLVTVPDMTPAM